MNILVAEDNLESRYLLQQYFSALGHTVVTANDGREAMAAVYAKVPDLIVSDALMPGVDGFQFCYSIKQHPEYYRIPFVFYTATYTDADDEQFALRIGADRFVVKPVEPDELMAMINETLERLKVSPRSGPLLPEMDPGFWEGHGQRLSVKLELKLAELQTANKELRNSEQAIRQLNERLVATVRALEQQMLERESAEAALRVREELLRNAEGVGHLGSWECDLGQAEMICSDEMYRIFGREPEDFVFTSDALLAAIVLEDRESFAAALHESDAKHSDLSAEVRIARPDGAVRHVFVRRQIFRDSSDRPARLVGIVQDITERKLADAQRGHLEAQLRQAQKMEAIGNLAGGIAHDFNNILTAIMAHAELLELELPTKPSGARDSVAEITSAANRARDLVKQILTFSRKQTVERRRIVLRNVVQDALRLVRATIPHPIELRFDSTAHDVVLANEGQIHQVVLNLCTNASHAIGERKGSIRVSLSGVTVGNQNGNSRGALRPGEYLKLEVNDDGSGMDAATLERIYEPFFTTKPIGQGTGLGLAVVHGIVQAHEGSITVESAPGKGTSFSILLPVAPIARGDADRSAGPATDARGRRVLFVDDEPSVAKIGARLLERLGYSAVALTDSTVARDRLLSSPDEFDVVITDYLMPRMTGLDLAKAVWSARQDLPVILAVGFGGQLDSAKAKAYGFSGFIAKPFSLQSLSETLARALQK